MTDEERAFSAYDACDQIPAHDVKAHAKQMAPFFAVARGDGARAERDRIRELVGAHIAQWDEYPDGSTLLDILPFIEQQERFDDHG